MGTTGSHPDIYNNSNELQSCRQMRYIRRSVPKKYSLPAHLSCYPGTKQKFFPPPILHTKFHELGENVLDIASDTVNFDKFLKQSADDGDKEQRRVLFRKSTVDDSAFRKISEIPTKSEKKLSFSPMLDVSLPDKSSPTESGWRKVAAKVSSTSSVSSGVGSVSEEDAEIDAEAVEEKKPMQSEEIGVEHENEAQKVVEQTPVPLSSDTHIPRRSLDSGTSFEEEDAKSAAVGDFETVFEEHENADGDLSVDEAQKTESRKKRASRSKKNSHKYSLAKSFQKMRKRAVSLPSTYVGNLLKKKIHKKRTTSNKTYVLCPSFDLITNLAFAFQMLQGLTKEDSCDANPFGGVHIGFFLQTVFFSTLTLG
ncbi:unnamed protein product [Gongylonema pulchrum]|uniref:Suppressor protein SRP40-like n=1 Tax=Gongylonema pulchrum TaxID=637853 RepID=A0A183DVM0_9BILA|nr:unnamed protein product [Gongylonema pulchrum]